MPSINPPNAPLTNMQGGISPEWYRFFAQHQKQSGMTVSASIVTVGDETSLFPHSRKLAVAAGELVLTNNPPNHSIDISLADVGTAGTYGSATELVGFTVDDKGRVISTNTYTLDSDNITEGTTNLFYTDARARAAISAGTALTYDTLTGVVDMPDVITAGTYGSASKVLAIDVDDKGRVTSATEYTVAMPIAGSTEIDFGATPTDGATLTLAVPGVTSATVVQAWISAGDTSADNDIGQHAIASVAAKILAVPSTDQIDFEAHNLFGLATGKFKLRYQYS